MSVSEPRIVESTVSDKQSSNYIIIFDQTNGKYLMEEIRQLQGKSIKTDHKTYSQIVSNLENCLMLLKDNHTEEKKQLQNLLSRFQLIKNIGRDVNYYSCQHPILCILKKDDSKIKGELYGIINGSHVLVKTSNGTHIICINRNNIQIINDHQTGGSKRKLSKKESPSSSSSSSSSTSSSSSSSSTEMITETSSSVQTESLTSTSVTIDQMSPYVATSEYLTTETSVSRTQKGGAPKKRNTESDISSIKFMKAGRSDKIGIVESNNNYYSESSSVESDLCE